MTAGFRIASLAVVIGVVIGVVAYPLAAFAQAPTSVMGTWKVNIAKSKYKPGPAPMSTISQWEAQLGGAAKNTNDIVDATGKASHMELVTTFDGKESPYKGALAPTTRAYTRIDDRTYQYVERVNGVVTTTNKVTMAANGKTRTQETRGTSPDGTPVNNTTVWDRQ